MKRTFSFFLFVLATLLTSAQLDVGLIAYLPMNGTGSDFSGNANNALPSSGGVLPGANRHMVISGGTFFNGSNESGMLSFANSLLNARSEFSMSYWFSLNALNNGMSLVGQDNILETGFYTGPNRIIVFHPTGSINVPIASGINNWQHLVVTCSNTSINAYLNGVLISTATGNYSLGSNTTPTRIGGNVVNQSNNSWFFGKMDEIRFYNRVLTLNEIQELASFNGVGVNIDPNLSSSFCPNDNVSVAFTVQGTLLAENEFVLQLSDPNGDFSIPVELGRWNTDVSGTISGTIPDGVPSGANYRVRVVSTALDAISNASNSFSINGTFGDIPNTTDFKYIGKINNKNLFLASAPATWSNASSSCIANGGVLATIANVEENVFIANYLTTTSAFIGLSDQVTEGFFEWQSDSPLTYSNWVQGEPNNSGSNEDFAELQIGGRWNDLAPTSTRLAVLQLEIVENEIAACENENINWNVPNISGASYSWSGPNGYSVDGIQAEIIGFQSEDAGIYSLTLTRNGCSTTISSNVQLAQMPIGVGESLIMPATVNSGLMLYYPMDGNANDQSGNSLNGNMLGTLTSTFNRFDETAKAIAFNGSNGYIDAPDGVYFDGTPFTISAWLNPVAFNSWSRIMDFGNASANNNVLIGATNGTTGRPAFQIYNGTIASATITAPQAISLQNWTHVAFAFENGAGRLYINGVLVNQGPQLFPLNITRSLCYIGRSNWPNDGYLNGSMDDFRIYNRILSSDELAFLVMEQPEPLEIIAEGGDLCEGNNVEIKIVNSQPGVIYQLRDATTFNLIGIQQAGSGDTLSFPSGALSVGIDFEFLATSMISGCERIIEVPSFITVLPLPQAPIAIPGEVCLEGEVTLGASSEESNSDYNWYSEPAGGALLQTGTSSTFITPSLNVSQNYYVSVTNENGCESERTLVVATVINPLNPPVDLVSNLILFYKMDGDILDESGNNINGNVIGGSSFYSSDRFGNEENALNIGPNAYVDAGNPAPFNQLTNEVTISMWVRQTQSWFGDQTPLMNKWGGTGMYMALDGYNSSNPQNRVRWRINGSNFLNSNTNVPLLQWHHIVCTYNGAQLRIYQNGVLTGTLNQTGNIPGTGSNLQIGRQANGLGAIDYRGDLDHIRVYSRALNQSEISTLYNNESVAFGPQAFCDGEGTIALTTFDFPNATYAWSGPNNYSSDQQNPPVIENAQAGLHDGEYELEVTVNGCTSEPQPVSVVIHAFPEAPETTNAYVCQSGNATLLASGAENGASYRWYTLPSGGTAIANQTSNSYSVSNVTATTTYYVSIFQNGCEGPRSPATIYYFTTLETNLPVVGNSACSSENEVEIGIENAQEGTLYQPFLGDVPLAEALQGPGNLIWIIDTEALMIGNNTITITATQPNCGEGELDNPAIVHIIEAIIPEIISSNGLQICNGENTVLSTTGGQNFLWNTGDVTSSILVNQSGSYSVLVTDQNNCTALSNELEITVNEIPNPQISINGDVAFCDGNSTTLQASGGASYFWNTGDVGSQIEIFESGTYFFTASNGDCTAMSTSVNIEVYPLPVIAIEASTTAVCSGEEVVLTASGNGTISWDNNVINGQAFSPIFSQNYTASVSSPNGCSVFDNISISVIEIPAPVVMASPLYICSESGESTLSVAPIFTSYTWFEGNNEISGENTASLVVTNPGQYTIEVTNNFGCSIQSEIEISEAETPEASFTLNESTICANEMAVLTAASVVGASYEWRRNDIVVQNNSSTFSTNVSGIYSVVVTNAQGCSATSQEQTLEVLALPNPEITSTTNQICAGNTATLAVEPIPDATYQWYFNDSPVSNATSQQYDASVAGNYYVTATTACVGASNAISISTLPLPSDQGSINGFNDFCFGDALSYTISDVPNATNYQWTISPPLAASIGAGQGTSDVVVNTTNQNFVISVTPYNSCGAGLASTLNVAGTDDFPCSFEIMFAGYPTAICEGSTVVFTNYSDAAFFGGGVPQWNFGLGAIPATASGNGPHTVTYTTPGSPTVTLSYVDPFSGFVIDSYVRTAYIQVSEGDAVTSSISGAQQVNCASAQETYSVENTLGSTYQWTVPTGTSIVSGQGTSVIVVDFNGNGGVISVTQTTSNGCVAEAQSISVECLVGIHDYTVHTWKIYPNPVSDILYLRALPSWAHEVTIYDLTGKLIYQTSSQGQLDMDVSFLSNGVYVIAISGGDQIHHQPFIKAD